MNQRMVFTSKASFTLLRPQLAGFFYLEQPFWRTFLLNKKDLSKMLRPLISYGAPGAIRTLDTRLRSFSVVILLILLYKVIIYEEYIPSNS